MKSNFIKRTNSSDPDFRSLVSALDADLRDRNGQLMDIYDQYNIIKQINTVVVAYADGAPAGCGCFQPYDSEAVEVKRMFVLPSLRGKGISLQILQELENWARTEGNKYIVLETGSKQVEALHLYAKAGYSGIAQYGPYVGLPDSICFRKLL